MNFLRKNEEIVYSFRKLKVTRPHGDASIYGALINMAQSFKMNIPLVDGHGNLLFKGR